MTQSRHTPETLASGQEALHTESRDHSTRTVTLFLLGRLGTSESDGICRIRNISSGGMQIESISPLAVGQKVEIAARNERPVRGTVAWTKDTIAGIQFDETVNHGELLRPPVLPMIQYAAIRAPRFSSKARAVLTVESDRHKVQICNIAPGGVRLDCAETLPEGNECHLAIPGLPRLHCVIRWAKQNSAGIRFVDKLGYSSLAPWLYDRGLRFAEER